VKDWAKQSSSSWYQSTRFLTVQVGVSVVTRLLIVQVGVSVVGLIADFLGDEFLQIIELLVTS
jgi:hypothetical protein